MKISRVRLALEASQSLPLLAGAQLKPSAELGIRYDGGDGTTGSALEMGAALRYIDPQAGFSVAGNMHALIRQGDSQEWGVQGLMRFTQSQDGRGLSFRLHSGYGADARAAVQEIWKQDLYQPQGGDHDSAISLEAHLGYGVSAPTKRRHGLLTPYTEFTRAVTATNYRLGLRWQLTSFAEFDLKWSTEQRAAGRGGDATTEHAMQLKATARF